MPKPSRRFDRLCSREAALVWLLALITAGFGLTVPNFLLPENLLEQSRYWVELGMVAVPMTLIIATGGIDLSVGSMLALSGMVLGACWHGAGLDIRLCAALAVATGLLCGLFNGLAITALGIAPLVVTLATMAMYRGLAMGIFGAVGQDLIRPGRGFDFPRPYLWLGQGTIGPVPVQLLAWGLIAAVGIVVLHRTWIGRYTLAMGENPTAARFGAVPVRGMTLGLYGMSGLICGLSAVTFVAREATAKPDAAMGFELAVIACVVIGGTRITGGSASVVGTLLGVLILGMMQYGMEMAGLRQQRTIIVVGLIVIVTAVFNEWMARRQETLRQRRPGQAQAAP